jgi:mRNA-degrading endonuclease toxin of MazEF toxin-antitoxin module
MTGLLHKVMVAPITSTVHGARSEVIVAVKEALKNNPASSLDHVQTVEQERLARFIGQLDPVRMRQVCRAMAIAVGRDE